MIFRRMYKKKFFGNSIFSATFNVQVATEDETMSQEKYVWKVLVRNMFDQVQGLADVHWNINCFLGHRFRHTVKHIKIVLFRGFCFIFSHRNWAYSRIPPLGMLRKYIYAKPWSNMLGGWKVVVGLLSGVLLLSALNIKINPGWTWW